MAKSKRKLYAWTPEKRRFCEEMAIPGVAITDAARRSALTIEQARRLLKEERIQQSIASLKHRRIESSEVEAQRVLREIAKIAFANMKDFVEWGAEGVTLKESSEISREKAAAISEISESVTVGGGTKRLKLHNKLDALGSLARYLGLFSDNQPPDDDTAKSRPVFQFVERDARNPERSDADRDRTE